MVHCQNVADAKRTQNTPMRTQKEGLSSALNRPSETKLHKMRTHGRKIPFIFYTPPIKREKEREEGGERGLEKGREICGLPSANDNASGSAATTSTLARSASECNCSTQETHQAVRKVNRKTALE